MDGRTIAQAEPAWVADCRSKIGILRTQAQGQIHSLESQIRELDDLLGVLEYNIEHSDENLREAPVPLRTPEYFTGSDGMIRERVPNDSSADARRLAELFRTTKTLRPAGNETNGYLERDLENLLENGHQAADIERAILAQRDRAQHWWQFREWFAATKCRRTPRI